MKRIWVLAAAAWLLSGLCQAAGVPAQTDWAQLQRYREVNANLPAPKPSISRIVFLGDSITESWDLSAVATPGVELLNRGISGQTTPQMLVRFRQDVIDLQPSAVHILAGTNDLAENTGPTTLEAIEDNLTSMVELAQDHHIRVMLGSVPPVFDFPWKRGLRPARKVAALNKWMRAYAKREQLTYVNYFGALVDLHHGFKSALSEDGVHPNRAGYTVMSVIAKQAIAKALK